MSINHSLQWTSHCYLTGNWALCRNDAFKFRLFPLIRSGPRYVFFFPISYKACIGSKCASFLSYCFIRRHLFGPLCIKIKARCYYCVYRTFFNKVIKVFHQDYAERANDAVWRKKKKRKRQYYKVALLKSESYHVDAYSLFFFCWMSLPWWFYCFRPLCRAG